MIRNLERLVDETARHVGHIPLVLYHWRAVPGSTATTGAAKPESFITGRNAVQEAFTAEPFSTNTLSQPEALARVLRLPTVADKTFLITIGDRSGIDAFVPSLQWLGATVNVSDLGSRFCTTM